MFESYTEKARRTIFFARYEASQHGSRLIEAPHLLLGLMRESFSTIQTVSGVDRTTFQRAIEALCAKSAEVIYDSADLPLSHPCQRVLAYAAEEAERQGQRHVGLEHLLLGVLRENGPELAVLAGFQIDLKTAREAFGVRGPLRVRVAAVELPAQVPVERLEAAIRILAGLSAEYFTVAGTSSGDPFAYTFGEPPA